MLIPLSARSAQRSTILTRSTKLITTATSFHRSAMSTTPYIVLPIASTGDAAGPTSSEDYASAVKEQWKYSGAKSEKKEQTRIFYGVGKEKAIVAGVSQGKEKPSESDSGKAEKSRRLVRTPSLIPRLASLAGPDM